MSPPEEMTAEHHREPLAEYRHPLYQNNHAQHDSAPQLPTPASTEHNTNNTEVGPTAYSPTQRRQEEKTTATMLLSTTIFGLYNHHLSYKPTVNTTGSTACAQQCICCAEKYPVPCDLILC